MKKIIILLALLALTFGAFSCGGNGAGSADVPPGENPGTASAVQLLPTHFIAQTNSSIFLKAKVLDGNGMGVPNKPVIFTNLSSIGVLSSTAANTDDLGIATVTFHSTTSGFATVQAEVNTGAGQVRDKKTVFFSLFDIALPAPISPTLSLDVDTDGLFNTPNEQSDLRLFENANDKQVFIRATVFDSNGSAVAGSSVTFGADSTEASFPLGSQKVTNSNGQASVLVQVEPSILRSSVTVLNITASAGNGAANMVSLFIQPVTVSSITVTANPSVVDIDETSTINAVVLLSTGAPAPDGTTVSFTTTCGSVEPFAQTSSGVAVATFTAPSAPGTCIVRASIGLTSGQTNVLVSDYYLLPEEGTIPVDGSITFTIFGGVEPFDLFLDNPIVDILYEVDVDPRSFTVAAGDTTGTVNIQVRDANGRITTATVTIEE